MLAMTSPRYISNRATAPNKPNKVPKGNLLRAKNALAARARNEDKIRALNQKLQVKQGPENEEDLTSESDSEVFALPVTVLPDRVNRGIGMALQNDYETTDEEEESECESSLETSVEYKPLDFTVVTWNRPKALFKPKMVSYRVNESVESKDELSLSEAPLAVEFQYYHRRSSQPVPPKGNIESIQTGTEVDEPEDKEETMNSVLIERLVKRLRDPRVEVKAHEFEKLSWDDPRFEDVLRTLKQIASYIEVKETILAASKEGRLRGSERIDQKIKEAIMRLPDVIVTRVDSKRVERARSYVGLKRAKDGAESPADPQVPHIGSKRGAKPLVAAPAGVLASNGREAHMGAHPSRKKRMTDSMLLAGEPASNRREAHMGAHPSRKKKMTDSMLLAANRNAEEKVAAMASCDVSKKKRRDTLMTSLSSVCVAKEAFFSEEEKPRRRKRTNGTSRPSLVMDDVPDMAPDEIVEAEYMTPEEMTKIKAHQAEGVVGNTREKMKTETQNVGKDKTQHDAKEHVNEKVPPSKKKRQSRRNRSISLLVDDIPDVLAHDDVTEDNTAPLTKGHACAKKGGTHAKNRRPRNANNRSISFAEVLEEDKAGELIESLKDQSIGKEVLCPGPPLANKESKKGRRSRPNNNAGRNNLSFSELPEEMTEAIEEDDTAIVANACAPRAHRKLSERQLKSGNAARQITAVQTGGVQGGSKKSEEEKNRHQSTVKSRRELHAGKHKSRELEYSLLPDEIPSEIKDIDGDSGLISGKTALNSYLGGRRISGVQRDLIKDDKSVPSGSLPSVNPKSVRNARTKPDGHLNQSLSIVQLPELAVSEIPDSTAEQANAAKKPRKSNPPQDVKHKHRVSRRHKSNAPNRSHTSFVALPEDEVHEVRESVDESLIVPPCNGEPKGEIRYPTSNGWGKPRKNSAACHMTSLGELQAGVLDDNVEFPINQPPSNAGMVMKGGTQVRK
ncbi:putative axoneme central apparatus protein [Trypanosoma grayi]|uniref:putative axoneme central apparatus protein n=1 Tax=Trypanosoma grayi TaxID=71804 RepID=UPI0004F4186E|nr:putative axoneme central apparatus protein [Trypanosoma grayi]KEG09300.1 putative axoneme central apparatus protein [Trypanosoma grayi]